MENKLTPNEELKELANMLYASTIEDKTRIKNIIQRVSELIGLIVSEQLQKTLQEISISIDGKNFRKKK